ncbi:acyltransferase domain-containing protein [Shewanella sp. VB17]|uniref:type I polyketide synthase n=1 Tax=Shewanella sp. VB17 TaxID=2739432 RepID=UPI001566E19F|nr:type I polyketide synthase [Shewanella sp. VB17]NRD72184.1 acyltransferase domain-containing protein [Shewanella sp. VB17]
MLEVVNTYLHGYTAVPMLAVCQDIGIITSLEKGPVSVRKITKELSANLGYSRLIFRTLHALGYVTSTDRETYTLCPKFRDSCQLPEAILDLYHIDFSAYLFDGVDVEKMTYWLGIAAQGWGMADDEMQQLMDGAIMVPLLLALAEKGFDQQDTALMTTLSSHIHADVRPALQHFLAQKDLLESDGAFVFNQQGQHLCERALTMASTASYRPMLLGLGELLCGDPANVFGRDNDGHETHVDRSLNVIGSGFQHGKYFNDLAEFVVEIFNQAPVSEQPSYIVDMGCGDGVLLKTLYEEIVKNSLRGQHLEEYPLLLVGADFNEKSLQETGLTLEGLPHLLLPADIGKPEILIADLRAHGITDVDQILHVRSFLDHDRPIDVEAVAEDTQPRDDHVFINAAGEWIDSLTIARDLSDYLTRWAKILGKHGLILLEVFSLPVTLTREYFSQTECFHFDFYHSLSKQVLVDAGMFHQALASAGLYPDRATLVRYPKTTPFSRIVLQQVRPKNFIVRPVHLDDIPELLAIDQACWPENLRLSFEDIEARHHTFAEGQLVVEYEGRVVSVVYSQRINGLHNILSSQYIDYLSAHNDDGCYWQLLGLSTDPDYQSLSLGEHLLEHVLDLAALTSKVEAVYGVTRCLGYQEQSKSMEEYVFMKDAQGYPVEPLLRFHCSHGATIEQVVPGTRPEDVDNEGAGILIRYDLASRLQGPGRGKIIIHDSKDRIADTVAECMRRIMKNPETIKEDRPLKELGFDSMGLMEFRLLLNQAFGIEFEPAYFFNYTTVKAIAEYIAQQDKPEAMADKVVSRDTVKPASAALASSMHTFTDIAIVGMSMRFPGGIDTPEQFWSVLEQGGCVISRCPDDRWHEYKAELEALDPQWQHIQQGGFLQDIDKFDANFFHITPAEARALDPQQRILLELAWQAFEHAGIDAEKLEGEPVGIFLGAYTHDYEALTLRQQEFEGVDAYYGGSNALSTAAGRLAYFFDFHGPTATIDTACSSASTAIFSACQNLADGGAELAVAGSINTMITPTLSMAYAKAGMLSIDGLCKTFDSSANGYVRSEGGAVLLLKRKEDAIRDGDKIHAVIKSAALMQDGRTNGLTAPNGQAQEAVIHRALALSGHNAADVSYVEAHGTGTYLGDPVEMQALKNVYCDGVERPSALKVGSVKTNLGHTEAASGMAGIIKVALAMKNKWIPPHLHVKQINELLRTKRANVDIPLWGQRWETSDNQPRLAGISSFGFSGSNTHIIIEEFIETTVSQWSGRCMLPAVISAKSQTSLRNNLLALNRYVDECGESLDLAALSKTLTQGRTLHEFRCTFSFNSLETLRESLQKQLQNLTLNTPVSATTQVKPRIAFMFTGQGSQYSGMARSLAQLSPRYREHLESCAALVRQYGEFELLEVIWGEDQTRIHQPRYTQVALFCIEYSLAELLREAGIEADAVLGHSVGEYAAACYGGVMSLASAIRLLCHRGLLMDEQTRKGSMVALLAPLRDVEPLLHDYDLVSIAAFNGPSNQVIAGDPKQVAAIVANAEQKGIRAFTLPVERAFHSPLMTPILAPFQDLADTLTYNLPKLALFSNLIGDKYSEQMTGQYWADHISSPVCFEQSVRSLLAHGVDMVVEIGPRPVLTNMAALVDTQKSVIWLSSILDPDSHTLAEVFIRTAQAGLGIDWRNYPHESSRQLADVPHYQFDRSSYWIKEKPAAAQLPSSGEFTELAVNNVGDATVLGLFPSRIDPKRDQAVWAHMIGSDSIFPASGYISLLLEAGMRCLKRERAVVLRDLHLEQMLKLGNEQSYGVEITASELPSAVLSLALSAWQEGDNDHSLYAKANVETLSTDVSADDGYASVALPAISVAVMRGEEFYQRIVALGYTYQAPFQGIKNIRRADDTFVVELSFSDMELAPGYAVTPWSLDGCFQTVLAVMLDELEANADHLLLPVIIEEFTWLAPLPSEVRVACKCQSSVGGGVTDMSIYDVRGELLVKITGLNCLWVKRESLGVTPTRAHIPAIYTPDWHVNEQPVELIPLATVKNDANSWLILSDDQGQGAALAALLTEADIKVEQLHFADFPADGSAQVALAERLRHYADVQGTPFGFVYAWPIDRASRSSDMQQQRVLDLVVLQFLAKLPAECLHRAIFLTQLSQPVQQADVMTLANSAGVWGLVNTLKAEVATHSLTLVDVDNAQSETERQHQAKQILLTSAVALPSETLAWPEHFALRGSNWYQRKLTSVNPAAAVTVADSGSYIVSGGLGGLGRLVVEFLHKQNAGQVVLLGRTVPDEVPAWVQALNRQRDCVTLHCCDVTVSAEVSTIIELISKEMSIRGIIHTAGIVEDALLAGQSPASLQAVYAPKVAGARNLLNAVPEGTLDFVWLFSSVVGLLGAVGQASYALANAELDYYAFWLRKQGISATSINWGLWQDTGMVAHLSQPELVQAAHYMDALNPEHSSELFTALLEVDEAQCCVARWRTDLINEAAHLPTLLSSLRTAQAQEASVITLADTLEGALGDERLQRTRRFVAEKVADITGLSPAMIEPLKPFSDYGVTSIVSIELSASLTKSVGSPFATTLMFDHPSLEALAKHVLACSGLVTPEGVVAQVVDDVANRQPILIDSDLDEIENLCDEDLQALLAMELTDE